MYFPAGWVHYAAATASPSLHLTLAVQIAETSYGLLLLTALADALNRAVYIDPTFRAPLPAGFLYGTVREEGGRDAGPGAAEMRRTLPALVEGLTNYLNVTLPMECLAGQQHSLMVPWPVPSGARGREEELTLLTVLRPVSPWPLHVRCTLPLRLRTFVTHAKRTHAHVLSHTGNLESQHVADATTSAH